MARTLSGGFEGWKLKWVPLQCCVLPTGGRSWIERRPRRLGVLFVTNGTMVLRRCPHEEAESFIALARAREEKYLFVVAANPEWCNIEYAEIE